MIKVSTESLLDFLKESKLDPHHQNETGQIHTLIRIGGKEFPLFIRYQENSALIQLLTFMPVAVKRGTQADLARVLHLLNKELDIPGFGIDEQSETCFYRIVLPYRNQSIEADILSSYLNAIRLICETFGPLIISVAVGSRTFQEVLRASKHDR